MKVNKEKEEKFILIALLYILCFAKLGSVNVFCYFWHSRLINDPLTSWESKKYISSTLIYLFFLSTLIITFSCEIYFKYSFYFQAFKYI